MKMKIPKLGTRTQPGAEPPIPKAYRPWLMAALTVLVVSLFALVVTASLAFIYYANVLTPIWLTVLGTLSAMGVVAGFAGLFLLLVLAGYKSFKEDPLPGKIVSPPPQDPGNPS